MATFCGTAAHPHPTAYCPTDIPNSAQLLRALCENLLPSVLCVIVTAKFNIILGCFRPNASNAPVGRQENCWQLTRLGQDVARGPLLALFQPAAFLLAHN